jgi:hypothetical protein
MINNDTVTIRATVSFPALDVFETFKGQPTDKYGVQLANLSGPAVERLEELGIDVKFKDDDLNRGQFIHCRSQFPITNGGRFNILFEADGRTPFEGLPSDIGYGSVVKAKIKTYTTKQGDAKPSIVALIVEELAKPETQDFADEEVL